MTSKSLQRLADPFDVYEAEIDACVQKTIDEITFTVFRLDAKTNTRDKSETSGSSLEKESGESC